jgi:hypothetical protein
MHAPVQPKYAPANLPNVDAVAPTTLSIEWKLNLARLLDSLSASTTIGGRAAGGSVRTVLGENLPNGQCALALHGVIGSSFQLLILRHDYQFSSLAREDESDIFSAGWNYGEGQDNFCPGLS